MRKFFVLLVALAFSGPAIAAGTAPPVAAVAAPGADWTGIYGKVGLGWQNDGVNWAYTNFAPPQLPFSLSSSSASVIGTLGYQQQFSWLVVGAEVGAFAPLGRNAASVTANGVATTGPCANVPGVICRASIGSAGLVGGKLGVDWGDWLVYGVGGGVFSSSLPTEVGGVVSDLGQPNGAHGWYAGGGLDYMLYKSKGFDVIGGVEYERVKLDTVAECSVANVGIAGGCPGTASAAARLVSGAEDAVWATLTVKFNPFGP